MIKKSVRHIFAWILELLAVVFGLVVIGFAALFIRLAHGPVQGSYLAPLITKGIESFVPNTKCQIAHAEMFWDNGDRSVAFDVQDVKISGKDGAQIATLPNMKISFSVPGLLVGQFMPTILTASNIQIWVTRTLQNRLTFGGFTLGSGKDIEAPTAESLRVAMGAVLGRLAGFDRLDIQNVQITVDDAVAQKDWMIQIPKMTFLPAPHAMQGDVQIALQQKGNPLLFSWQYTYDRRKRIFSFTSRFRNVDPALFADKIPQIPDLKNIKLALSGDVRLVLDRDGEVVSARVEAQTGSGQIIAPALWTRPREIKGAHFVGEYSAKNKSLNIPVAMLDFGGSKLNLTASGRHIFFSNHDMDFEVKLALDTLPLADYGAIWPKVFLPNVREWIMANMKDGRFDGIDLSLIGWMSFDDMFNPRITNGDGHIILSNARVHYLDGLPDAQGVNARAKFDLDNMQINILSGHIGALQVQPSNLIIEGLQQDVPMMRIPLHVTAPIGDVLQFLDNPPWRYTSALGLTPKDITGAADIMVSISFPLLEDLKTEQVGIRANAKLKNFASTTLLPKFALDVGGLNFILEKEYFKINGTVSFNTVPLQVAWLQYFDQKPGRPLRQIGVTGTVADQNWQALGLPESYRLAGKSRVDLNFTESTKGLMQVNGNVDLADSDIQIADFNWRKARGQDAHFYIAATMPTGRDIRINTLSLNGAGANVKGYGTLGAQTFKLKMFDFNPFIVGRNQANLRLTQEGDGLKINAEGDGWDITNIFRGDKKNEKGKSPLDLQFQFANLYSGEGGVIKNARGYVVRGVDGWRDIDIQGQAMGNKGFEVKLHIDERGRKLSFMSDSLGDMLHSLGMTKAVQGGDLRIVGQSVRNPKIMNGTIKIGRFSIKDLPALTNIVAALTPFGFSDAFSGMSSFNHLDGKFSWDGHEIRLDDVEGVGDSLGVTANGTINSDDGAMALQGTAAPFNVINQIVGSIPIIGDLMGGTKGAVAVTYKIKGTVARPRFFINATSLLTPGVLRDIFFPEDEIKSPKE